ncbi:hypothetical protein [Xanthomonas campestris]|uniref:Secreted protein n=1 Tax=Xanthomonas campestris pv. papavericola TaxID=487881 RepID=A0AAJ2X2H0_XANCA|nr:hypothetical protein [Xanthomonas campestris]MEC3887827.1 hypothetical protein [Xanthomonas campestris pv. papavericola]
MQISKTRLSLIVVAVGMADWNSAYAATRDIHEVAPATAAAHAQTAETLKLQHAWQAALAAHEQKPSGCFVAKAPSTEWKRVPCQPVDKAQPVRRPATVTALMSTATSMPSEAITDYALEAHGLIRKAQGSFPVVNGVHTIRSNGTTASTDEFSLQLNSGANASTSACAGHPNCYIWQQFIYAMRGEGAVFLGNGNGTAAVFNTGSSLTTRLAVNDGTRKAPRCIGNGAVTGERSNLRLGSCTASAGTSPSIQFTGQN